ncbi:hypothetical protein Tco_1013842 [Tanacetum coccineum]
MLKKFILKIHHLSDHNEEEIEEDDNPNEMDNVPEIFRIEGNLFDFKTTLCEAYHEFSCFLNIDIDLFTYDIQNFKTYDEYKQELNDDEAKGTKKPWPENGIPYQLCDHIREPYRFKNGGTKWPTYHRWYDELANRKLKDETLALKAKIKGSWGDATPGVVKFCKWLKSFFENFHELEYEVLANNPYLDINRTFGRDYEASNTGCTQEYQEHKGDPIPEPSNSKVRRFEMMKYSFNDEEE